MDQTVLRMSDEERVKDALAVQVMGYTISGDLYVKDNEFPIIRREFSPMTNLSDAFLVIQALTAESKVQYTLSSYGRGHRCIIDCEPKQKIGNRNALKPEEAICMAVFMYAGIQTDYEEPTFQTLRR